MLTRLDAIMTLALSLLAAGCGAPQPPPSPAPASIPAQLLEARAATGGAAWDRVPAIESHATLAVGGMTGTVEMLEDVVTGRSLTTVAVGPLREVEGWDGRVGWERGATGEVSTLDAPPAVAFARTGAWLTRRGYFRHDGAVYRDLGQRDGHHEIEATPEGGSAVVLRFDATGKLARAVRRRGTTTISTDFSDYRAVGGVQIPFRIAIDQGDPRNGIVLAITTAKVVAAPQAAVFAPPAAETDRISFANGGTQTQVPFELINNHVYVRATVDGHPVRMIVDTGGRTALTQAAARRLGINAAGELAVEGAGATKAAVGFARAGRLALGGVVLADPMFAVIDVGLLADIEGEDLDGVVGHELFHQARVRLDYPARTLTLTSPASFTAPRGAVAVPFVMDGSLPTIQGAIDGVRGQFWIDTGSRLTLTTMSKFTRDHGLVAKYKPRFETVTGWGIGGATRTSPVRLREVELGGVVVRDVVGDLFTGDRGAFADPDVAGNIGSGLLRRFAVTFDYAAKVMYLEPAATPEPRDTFDRAGMFLRRDGDALAVVAVVPRGPADAAGIRADDRITAIDGAAVRARKLAAWRASLRDRPAGTEVRVHVTRLGDVKLVLAELVP
jgi:predicted aspartyl protease